MPEGSRQNLSGEVVKEIRFEENNVPIVGPAEIPREAAGLSDITTQRPA
jgi:hypothetical protein